jgi:hypothetical protein
MRTDGAGDRQTDMTNLIFAFRNFVNAPNERPKANSTVKNAFSKFCVLHDGMHTSKSYYYSHSDVLVIFIRRSLYSRMPW